VTGAAESLTELRKRGVTLTADGDTLCLRPRRVLDEGLLARVRAEKPAILEALRNRVAEAAADGTVCGSPNCAGCYHIGEGRRIHPPKCGESYRKWLERWQPTGKPQ
jgi:hypothetical protein